MALLGASCCRSVFWVLLKCNVTLSASGCCVHVLACCWCSELLASACPCWFLPVSACVHLFVHASVH